MERYKLIDAVTVPMVIDVFRTDAKGNRHYEHKTFEPGKEYEIAENDKGLRESIIGATAKVVYTKKFEEALKACNAKYKVVKPTCHCRYRENDIVFTPTEVVEV